MSCGLHKQMLRGLFTLQVGIEGEDQKTNPLVEGELSGINHHSDDDQGNEFHDINDNISIIDELSEARETLEDVYLEFDPTYPPMEKSTRDHPKEHILGDPTSCVLTWAQVRARNEVLNVHQEYFMFNVLISKIKPKQSRMH